MCTKVKNQTGIAKSNERLLIATAALRKSMAGKPKVDMIQAQLYPTYAEIFCLINLQQTRGKISLDKLEKFVCEDFSMVIVPTGSDMNLAIYIEDNLKNICAAYIAAGKEIMPL